MKKIKQFFILSYQIVYFTLKILFNKPQKIQTRHLDVTSDQLTENVHKANMLAIYKYKDDFKKNNPEPLKKVRDKQLSDIFVPNLEVKEYEGKDLERLVAMRKFVEKRNAGKVW